MNSGRSRWPIVWLTLILLGHAAQTVWVLALDRTESFLAIEAPYRGSLMLFGARHHQDARFLRPFGPPGDLLRLTHPHPPLLILVVQPIYDLAGLSQFSAGLSNLAWLALLFCSVFCLGRRMSDDAGGLLAVLVLGAFPQVLGHRAVFMPFLPNAALVAASAAALVAWHQDRRLRPLLLLGLFAGLGLLTRYDYAFPLAAFVGWHLAAVGPGRRRRALLWLLVPGVLAALLAGWWYVPAFGGVFHFYRGEGLFSTSVENDGIELWSWTNLTFHPGRLFTLQMGSVLGAACLAALVALQRRPRPGARLLLLWIALPLVCLFFLPMKKSRYALALLPAFALALALWLRGLPAGRLRRGLCAGVALLGLAYPVVLVHVPGAELLWPMLRRTPDTWGNSPLWELALDHGRLRPWTSSTWHDALQQLAREIDETGERRQIAVVAEEVLEYVSPLFHYSNLRDLHAEPWLSGLPRPKQEQVLERARFLILSARPGHPPDARLARRLVEESRRRPLRAAVRMPDGNHALLYGPRR